MEKSSGSDGGRRGRPRYVYRIVYLEPGNVGLWRSSFSRSQATLLNKVQVAEEKIGTLLCAQCPECVSDTNSPPDYRKLISYLKVALLQWHI